jgi:parallel beta-helix repeat protein
MIEHRLMASIKRRVGSTSALLVLSMGLSCGGTQAYAAPPPVACGAMITQNIKLQADVGPCAGDGLIVAANGISINLNGHKVFATQRLDIGIRLENVSNVSVTGGTVEGFDTGVLIVGGLADTVAYMTVQNNRFGIQVQNAPSSAHQISKNIVTNNRLIGILLSPDVSGATVNKNSASGNVGYAIVLDNGSSLNVISANEAFNNDAIHSGRRDVVLRRGDDYVSRTNLISPLLVLVSPNETTYVNGVDYQVLSANDNIQTAGIDITGRLIPIGITLAPVATSVDNPTPVDTSTSGCQLSDYLTAGFQPGNIALVQRGTCELYVKAEVASLARAAGLIIFNEGQAPTRTTFEFGNFASNFDQRVVLGASYDLGYKLYDLSRSGTIMVRIVAKTATQPTGAAGSTNNNQVIKNSLDHAFDETGEGRATSADSFICGTNQWIKNLIGGLAAAPCSVFDPGSGGGGGSGAVIHSY